ncbi:alpha/beta hydrolase [Brenneria rubrifaciens]|uniref:Alpha/beta hydrolase n=1 Tax=Brenneria rubrifaciens TaxID=55213 RepID=A0A4P8QTT4_9GAMM|nr:alpha/beta hydrolase [Brenneria rubrifaciens]QCR08830.1 alpha/beta hydrolase [Brenneria rubrifaciens]
MNFEPIEFATADGIVLRGRHYHARGVTGPAPVVVMAHGFSGVVELSLAPFAEAFAEAGLGVLVYDHRNFGHSDGVVRQEVDPTQQINDWREAITFAQGLPEVDPERVGIWGSSLAGGHVLVLGATDSRVGCVVSQVPFTSGSRQSRLNLTPVMQEMSAKGFAADRAARMRGEAPVMLPVTHQDPTHPAVLSTPEAHDWTVRNAADAPSFHNEVTLRSLELAAAYEPGGYVGRIAPVPLLMIIGRRDDLASAELALETYAQALEPKQLLLLQGGHFAPYDEEFVQASSAAVDWFSRHLTGAG